MLFTRFPLDVGPSQVVHGLVAAGFDVANGRSSESDCVFLSRKRLDELRRLHARRE